jgi:hypothetical protein
VPERSAEIGGAASGAACGAEDVTEEGAAFEDEAATDEDCVGKKEDASARRPTRQWRPKRNAMSAASVVSGVRARGGRPATDTSRDDAYAATNPCADMANMHAVPSRAIEIM